MLYFKKVQKGQLSLSTAHVTHEKLYNNPMKKRIKMMTNIDNNIRQRSL